MKVHFKKAWFAPSDRVQDPNRPKGLPISGTRYRRSASIHDLFEVPEELRAFLPSSATVIEAPEAAPAPKKETLRDHDMERHGQDEVAKRLAELEATKGFKARGK